MRFVKTIGPFTKPQVVRSERILITRDQNGIADTKKWPSVGPAIFLVSAGSSPRVPQVPFLHLVFSFVIRSRPPQAPYFPFDFPGGHSSLLLVRLLLLLRRRPLSLLLGLWLLPLLHPLLLLLMFLFHLLRLLLMTLFHLLLASGIRVLLRHTLMFLVLPLLQLLMFLFLPLI
jgi:hypothetical protein